MTIIRIEPHENGAHDNQTIKNATPDTFSIPDGWALVPDTIVIPETFPFVDVTVEDGVVTSMTAGTMPEPEPEPELPPTDTEVLNALLGVTEDE